MGLGGKLAGFGAMRTKPVRRRAMLLLAIGAFAGLALMEKQPEAFTAPPSSTSASKAGSRQEGGSQLMAGKKLCGRNTQAAAQQAALPPRRIGASLPVSTRRSRLAPRKKLTDLRASFTSMVVDIAANPRVLLGEIAVVVILSGLFETGEHKIRKNFARTGRETGAEIMNALFKEITTLGFVAFVIFLVTHTGTADKIAPLILRDDSIKVHGHNPLSATFETVHMIIFMLLVVLLMQAAAMYMVSEQICARWGGYERTVSYGSGRATIESKFVEAGYLKREPDASSPRGVKLEEVKDFEYGKSWVSRLFMRRRPLHKLLMWRAIRHEFLFPAEPKLDKKTVRVPDTGLFSMEDYFRTKLGKVVLGLIHVDRWTWVASLGILAVPLYLAKHVPHVPSEAIHCVMAWFIALIGGILAIVLERDVYQFTPKIPTKVKEVLKIFSGENFQILRRAKLPGWKDRPLAADSTAARSSLELPEAMTKTKRRFLSIKGYSLLFRMLSFFQAVSFTALLLSHLTAPFNTRAEWAWYLGALIEWPFFLFVIVPVIIRRLTIRSSIAYEKDEKLIRKVTTDTKESLIRDYARLVLIQGYEKEAVESKAEWTLDNGSWDTKKAVQNVLLGLRKFDKFPEREKREIWAIFAAWDTGSSGSAEPKEFIEAFKSMGNERAEAAVENITRLVDFDGSSTINWMKYKAIYGLATADRSDESMCNDFKESFKFFDANENGELSIFELSKGFAKMNVGVDLDDIANLLFLYFGIAKPTVTMDEFVDWVLADRKSTLAVVPSK